MIQIRSDAWRAVYMVVAIWAISTGLALYALMLDEPQWCKFALCWQIFLLPGAICSKVIEHHQKWRGTHDDFAEAKAAAPFLISGPLSVAIFFGL